MDRRTAGTVALALLLVTAGGYLLLPGDDAVRDGSTVGRVTIDRTQPDGPASGFQFVGLVGFSLDPSAVEDSSFEEVQLCLYDENGTVLAARDLGTFEVPSAARNVSVTTAQPPAFVAVHHPRFDDIEGYGGFSIEVLVYRPAEDAFAGGTVADLPVDYATLPQGDCRPSATG